MEQTTDRHDTSPDQEHLDVNIAVSHNGQEAEPQVADTWSRGWREELNDLSAFLAAATEATDAYLREHDQRAATEGSASTVATQAADERNVIVVDDNNDDNNKNTLRGTYLAGSDTFDAKFLEAFIRECLAHQRYANLLQHYLYQDTEVTKHAAVMTKSKVEEILPHMQMQLMDLRKHLHVIDRSMYREALMARGPVGLSDRVDFVYLWMGALTVVFLGVLGWGYYNL